MPAYHTLTRALETAAQTPLPARQLFAAAVGHVLNGFVTTERFQHAGRMAGAKRHSESAIARIVTDALRIDLNPFLQCMVRARTPHRALLLHQSLTSNVDLPVRTEYGFDGKGIFKVRSSPASSSGDHPASCSEAALIGLEIVLSSIAKPGTQTIADNEMPAWGGTWVRPPECVSGLAALLGLGASVASEAALAFESDTTINVQDMARHLGCHSRTLQREFKACGVSAETLKRACMLSQATALLSTTKTLTAIAHEAGYADHAHMTRAFVTSCGLPPSILRQAFVMPLLSTTPARSQRTVMAGQLA
ncbi:MAG: helix-turn-helix domain-containing protein [Candidatus Saccharibacteria bacterium]|nr:helix-turn-helix domain-containing protein [Rhodoferax sp.]